MRPMRCVRSLTVVLIPWLALSCGAEPGSDVTAQDVEPLRAGSSSPLAIVVPAAPRPVVTTDRKQHLLYELVLTNVGAAPVELASVQVSGDDPGRTLVRYAGDDLRPVLIVVGDDGSGALAPGGQGG
jgi:hypothetical protein